MSRANKSLKLPMWVYNSESKEESDDSKLDSASNSESLRQDLKEDSEDVSESDSTQDSKEDDGENCKVGSTEDSKVKLSLSNWLLSWNVAHWYASLDIRVVLPVPANPETKTWSKLLPWVFLSCNKSVYVLSSTCLTCIGVFCSLRSFNSTKYSSDENSFGIPGMNPIPLRFVL